MKKEEFIKLFEAIENSFKAIEDLAEGSRKDFGDLIKDKSVPLDERWELFCRAPDSIKLHDRWIHEFKWEEKHQAISWYDDFYMDRHQTVDMQAIIEIMEENESGTEYSEEMILDMKEEILDKNLGSFCNDW